MDKIIEFLKGGVCIAAGVFTIAKSKTFSKMYFKHFDDMAFKGRLANIQLFIAKKVLYFSLIATMIILGLGMSGIGISVVVKSFK
ncbi:MAG: hypothetical protein A2231_01235 [Candidatus Firestonebacteria bacterium RIFOXYA2_FULL_40_8]|nr:MAG: hypothetical protein A2231_01235 [Candidatus Firestonebacteria bacterium RIFOXYA2_FULL_40_8]